MCGYEAQPKENGGLSDEAEWDGQELYVQNFLERASILALLLRLFRRRV